MRIAFFTLLVTVAGNFVYGSPALPTSSLQNLRSITYQVIVDPSELDGNTVGVALGSKVYQLNSHPVVPMLYTGTGPSSSKPYRYVILRNSSLDIVQSEPFERPPIEHASHTFYETYGRSWNKINLPDLPQVYPFSEINQTELDPAASPLYEDGTIATLHFQIDDDELQLLHAKKSDKELKVQGTMTYLGYNSIQQFQDVKLKIGGHSSRMWAKVPYKIKISSKKYPNGLYRRWSFKLRSEATDPTMMREMIYNNLLQATGIVAARGVYTRLFLNNEPVGLYLMVDDSGSKKFVRETIHYGETNPTVGDIIKCDAGKGAYAANLDYLGDGVDAYDSGVYRTHAKTPEEEEAIMAPLINFMKFIKEYDPMDAPTDENALLEQWNKYIDVELFIRQLALEWITGNWDAIQYSGNNYVLYRKDGSTQFISIPMDFDYTFGNGLEEDQRNLLTGTWTDFTAGRKPHSFLWEKLREIPHFVDLYERSLNEIVTGVANPRFLFKRIDGLAQMLKQDVVWDRSLARMSPGITRLWDEDTFLESIYHGSGQHDEQIGLKEWIAAKAANFT
ncbi:coth protein-domain-containing protein [Dichotomocladium elegans]|nr:coth protein-domain-containing protein [Dichotomocladium elegans]